MNLKPNFTQGSVIRALEGENQHLKRALSQQAALTGLIEACATGFCAQSKDPAEIARLVVETSGAIANRLSVQMSDDTAPSEPEIVQAPIDPITRF